MVNTRRKKGFTLVEAMIALAVAGILISVGARLIIQANRYFVLSNARVGLQEEARSVMYVVTRNLRQAQNATITIGRYSASQPYYSQITFTTGQGATMTFFQNGNLLEMQSGTMTKVLCTDLVYLAFTFPRSDDMSIVSVSMTLQNGTYQGKVKALHMASEKVQVMN